MREYVSSASARKYIGEKFVARKEIIKYLLGLFLLGFLNIERETRFCIIIDQAIKAKCLYVKSLVVLFLFFPVVIKVCAYFFLDPDCNRHSHNFNNFYP